MSEINLERYLFDKKTIALKQDATDWKQAVRLATDLLENAGAVSPEYYQGILRNREKNGPYFVIVPSVAMPHAAPECGVNEDGFSLVTMKNPVRFGHEQHDPVELVLCIAARTRTSLNENVIVQIMNLLEHDEAIERLKRAEILDDVRDIFRTLGD